MKNIKRYIGFVAIVALLFTSCTKDENNLPNNSDTELATLSFAPLLANMDNARAALKQQETPDCSDTDPDSVQIILSNAEGDVVGSMGAPFSIDLVNGQLFTEEVEQLQLVPGVYSLDHFAVYNAADELIWLAPKTGSDFANFVDDPLPLEINLGAGVKKYVDVTVLCFDDRDVNEYGYLFFDLNPEVALEFCFFANYCDDDGRHFPASYSVSIWKGTDNTGDLLYSDMPNVTGQYPAPDDDYYADPRCFTLPPNDDMAEQYLYYEVTLLDWPEVYGTVSEPDITGTLSMNDIIANFDGDDNVNYEHLRFNCEGGNGECDPQDPLQDCDNDGVPNGDDVCPAVPGTVANNGCPEECDQTDPEADCDNDGILNKCDTDNPNYGTFDCDGDGFLNSEDNCPNIAGVTGGEGGDGCPEDPCAIEAPDAACDVAFFEGNQSFTQIVDPEGSPIFYALLDGQDPAGSVTVSIESGDPVVLINMGDGFSMDDYRIEVSQNSDGSNSTCVAQNNVSPPTGEDPDVFEIFDETADYVYPFYIKIEANYCPN